MANKKEPVADYEDNVYMTFSELKDGKITLSPLKTINKFYLRSYIRAEILYDEFIKYAEPEDNLNYPDEPYVVKLNDMEIAVENLSQRHFTAEELYKHWAKDIYHQFNENNYYCFKDDDASEISYAVFETIAGDIHWYCSSVKVDGTDFIDFYRILKDIRRYRYGLEICTDEWSYLNKIRCVKRLDNKDFINKLSDAEVLRYKSILEYLEDRNQPEALELIGYFCYGGNRFYECDWKKSRDCFLKLMENENVEDDKKGQYANTLGYIYYYGRCNNGVPEYEKAFKYFQIGAVSGYFESVYKLSDMYLHGYGTPVNKFVARNLVNLFYEENEKRFLDGDFECNFADLALRKANLCRDDIESGDPLYYYLIADFAIKKRLEFNYFGDTSVAMKIHDEIAKYEKDRPISHKKTHTSCYPYALNIAMQGSICKITFKELKSGIKITAKRMPPSGKDKARSFFIVEPYARYCILTDNVSETAKDVSNIWTENNSNTFYADSMEDTDGKLIFKFYGKEVAYIVAKKYSYTLKSQNEKSTEKHRFAKVLFKTKGRGYDYIADGIELSVGDKVIVPTYSGEVSATVIKVFELPFKDMPLEAKRYKKIVKKV